MKLGTLERNKLIQQTSEISDPKRAQKIIDLIRIADQSFGGPIPNVVLKNLQNELEFVPAQNYWRQLGISGTAIDHLLKPEDGSWGLKRSQDWITQGVTDKPEVFSQQAYQLTRAMNVPVQRVLDATSRDPETGFNDHSLLHLMTLLRIHQTLAPHFSLSQAEINLTTLGIYLHDDGNALYRGAHALLSTMMARELFQLGPDTSPEVVVLLDAILHHDEKVANALIDDIFDQLQKYAGSTDSIDLSSQLMERYAELFSRTSSYFRILDKSHNGFERVPQNGLTPKSLKDEHIANNLALQWNSTQLEKHLHVQDTASGKRMTYSLLFSLLPPEQLLDSPITVEKKRKRPEEKKRRREFLVPDELRKDAKELETPYMYLYFERYVRLYADRIRLEVLDAFNANPEINQFVFEVVDLEASYTNKNGESVLVEPVRITFTRDNVYRELQELQRVVDKPITEHGVLTLSNLRIGLE